MLFRLPCVCAEPAPERDFAGPCPAGPCSSLALPRADPCFSGWLLALGPGLTSFPTFPPALGWKEDGQVAVDAQCQQDHDSG